MKTCKPPGYIPCQRTEHKDGVGTVEPQIRKCTTDFDRFRETYAQQKYYEEEFVKLRDMKTNYLAEQWEAKRRS